MNKLPLHTRKTILKCLLDGMSIRGTARIADVSKNTVSKLLVEAGEACAAFHHEMVREVEAERVQCDEIWSFCYAKAKNVADAKAAPEDAGDVWTWTAIDADSKLCISYLVGGRDSSYARLFVSDLASRLASRVQLTTDGHKPYLEAIEEAFGADVDYAQLVKVFQEPRGRPQERRYSPGECCKTRKDVIEGEPDMAKVSTSFVERQNLTMRMNMRRFTRLTNAFSKKVENHALAVALHFMNYNFCRQHKSLNKWTPAMAAGLTDRIWDVEDIIKLVDERAPKPSRPKTYGKKEISN